jgi:two-component system chemotaxis sensor kinase CheA
MDELTREFLIESQEGLDRMERCLTELEERPQDAALIGDIFRSVHTIKGTTGFLGFKRLEKLAHAGENLLGLLREGKVVANRPTITGLLQLLDGLRSILRTIEAEKSEGAGEDTELIATLEVLQAPAQVKAKQPARVRVGARAVQTPPAGPQRKYKAASTPPHVSTAAVVPVLEVQPSAERDAATSRVPATGTGVGTAAESTLRVDITLLNRMMNLVGELVLTSTVWGMPGAVANAGLAHRVLPLNAIVPEILRIASRTHSEARELRRSVM